MTTQATEQAMREHNYQDTEPTLLAEEAADHLFHANNDSDSTSFEPFDASTANAAVRRLAKRFDELPGAIANALDAARNSGDLLSSDKLQGLAEIVQNADDVDATQIRLLVRENDLLIGHNGSPVRLNHILGLATPWLTTKAGDAAQIGRFGIGLSTLRSLSKTMEIHCSPYHVRFGDPVLSTIKPLTLPSGFDEPGWTTLRVPLDKGGIGLADAEEWLNRWDDAALLFLRNVTSIILRDPNGRMIRQLSISRPGGGGILRGPLASSRTVSWRRVEAKSGRSWIVYSEDAPKPAGLTRAGKVTALTIPIAIALPLHPVDGGQIHAGLPVTRTRLPLFANAQFDPLASRRDLADNEWNEALVPLIEELWSRAALDLFSRAPKTAWQAMPLEESKLNDTASPMIKRLEEAICAGARQTVASRLSFRVPGKGRFSLSQLAVEAKPLERILTLGETARLADLPAALPIRVRDRPGRWRSVLDDWRTANADIPRAVSVDQALDLVGDEMRPAHSTISLVAAALKENLEQRLLELPCVVACDGQHLVPPLDESPEAVAAQASPLAKELGLVTELHPAHLGNGKAARTVFKWLREKGALLDTTDDRIVVRRLATAGRSGHLISEPLSDQQVRALREAFELLNPAEQRDLGPNVGRAVALEAYEYEEKGRKRCRKIVTARAVDAYLPRSIDREKDSFAVAADKSLGLVWLSDHYSKILRSSRGREGVGALRFLRLLGAETAPQPRAHPLLTQRYTLENRLGLRRDSIPGGPAGRVEAMWALGATFTLQDCHSPALRAVVEDITHVRRTTQRRRRTVALLATLARAWDRQLNELSEVVSADDYLRWNEKGRIPAYWLWQVRDVAWLDDETGKPRRPSELHLRTPGTVAIYGENSPNFLHPDLSNPNWRPALSALGVSEDPSRSDLIDRLKQLRDDGEGHLLEDQEVMRETGVVYKALSQSLSGPVPRSDLNETQMRREFQRGRGLLFTNLGWQPPSSVLAGPPVFGNHRAFVPAIADTGRLWRALGLKQPAFTDCVAMIRHIARRRCRPDSNDEIILIETLRILATQPAADRTAPDRRKLTQLPLWTSKGWVRTRPVFATDDPLIADALCDRLPLWEPGGELEQFRTLLKALRVEEIQSSEAEVIEPSKASEDSEATDFFRSAVEQFQEDLVRNEPQLAGVLKVSWDRLRAFSVCLDPSLSLRVVVARNGTSEVHECKATVKVDISRNTVFIRESVGDLARVDKGGRAIASLFKSDPRRVAHAWRVACDGAEIGREARPLELALERAKREQTQIEFEIATRTAAFQEQTAAKHQSSRISDSRTVETPSPSRPRDQRKQWGEAELEINPPRVLVDPVSLRLVNPRGRVTKGSTSTRPTSVAVDPLVEPSSVPRVPHNRSPIRSYSDLDKENVGLEFVRMLLSSNHQEIIDLRAQRYVGADAVDELRQFYELKVSAGTAPEQVTLTNAEFKRALSTPKFFLVVVSDIEGVDARPTVRVFVDPLKQLHLVDKRAITLSGVRNTSCLAYDFAPINDSSPTNGE